VYFWANNVHLIYLVESLDHTVTYLYLVELDIGLWIILQTKAIF